MDSKEIRQLKLEKAKAIYENRCKIANLYYWVLIPLFITILFSLRTEIRSIFRPIFELITLIPYEPFRLAIFLTIIMITLIMIIFSPVIGSKIGDRIENDIKTVYGFNLNIYTREIDKLISEAEDEKSKKSNKKRILENQEEDKRGEES